jgi:hypothetical protein
MAAPIGKQQWNTPLAEETTGAGLNQKANQQNGDGLELKKNKTKS